MPVPVHPDLPLFPSGVKYCARAMCRCTIKHPGLVGLSCDLCRIIRAVLPPSCADFGLGGYVPGTRIYYIYYYNIRYCTEPEATP